MTTNDILQLHKIIDTLGAKSQGNDDIVAEAHRIINRLLQDEHFCRTEEGQEECVICGVKYVSSSLNFLTEWTTQHNTWDR